jgi:2-polyprenyl-3-methyl-5-hydroxy-6-metoxy-1,4-benzoquinol methylase
MKCRSCLAQLDFCLIDLGNAPLSNAYLTEITLRRPEKWFPLRVLVCTKCWLVQSEMYSRAAEIFNEEYAYFSSFSTFWLEHSKVFAVEAIENFELDQKSFVIEIASNDGYLLTNFKEKGIPCLGIEPTASTAAVARSKGIETLEVFFSEEKASEIVKSHGKADLIVANNVLAHVPDLIDFIKGIYVALKDSGLASIEVHNLVNLIKLKQFDTIYHEHFSYYSFTAAYNLFESNGLEVLSVCELPSHGGSIRITVQKLGIGLRNADSSVLEQLKLEEELNISDLTFYDGFADRANEIKNSFVNFLINKKNEGKIVVGYGAAAKGNTLINYSGVKSDLLQFVADRNTWKIGKYLPGSRIPIRAEEEIAKIKPDYIVIFPWNLRDEIVSQLQYCREWNAKFVTFVPRTEIL